MKSSLIERTQIPYSPGLEQSAKVLQTENSEISRFCTLCEKNRKEITNLKEEKIKYQVLLFLTLVGSLGAATVIASSTQNENIKASLKDMGIYIVSGGLIGIAITILASSFRQE